MQGFVLTPNYKKLPSRQSENLVKKAKILHPFLEGERCYCDNKEDVLL